VTTSLDITLQDKVQEIVRSNIDALSAYHVGNGAAVVTDPRNGQILAMVGSRDYFDLENDGNVNLALSLRQPGSSIKVVTYAEALETGMTAATLINDAPIVYQSAGTTPYTPVNYDGKFHGLVPLRSALANSYNIPAVKTLAAIGIPAMMAKAKLMGINSWSTDPSNYGLSLTLGSAEVTMLDMARVYDTLANGGTRVDLNPILEVKDYEGHVLNDTQTPQSIAAVNPGVAWILSNILADNAARTPAFGPNSGLVIPGKTVSVKTGTTNDKRDNWADGYTPSYTVIVWVGNNDNTPMNQAIASGITGATPIWHDIMTELLKDRPDEVALQPNTVTSMPCYNNRVEYFIQGTEPPGGRCVPIPTITPTPTPH
jgi:membrane peptidoglycan carboxypeptidase